MLDKLGLSSLYYPLNSEQFANALSRKLSDNSPEMIQHLESFEGFYAHEGMIEAATYVYKELMFHKVIEEIQKKVMEGHTLIVTGHSLGAGTAVLLSFLLKQKFCDLRCLAFSPPGGLLNENSFQASGRLVYPGATRPAPSGC